MGKDERLHSHIRQDKTLNILKADESQYRGFTTRQSQFCFYNTFEFVT